MKITTPNQKIKEEIEKIFVRQVFEELNKKSKLIQEDIRKFNLNLWKNTPTYQSLLTGQLTHEFGIPEGTAQSRVDNILEKLSQSLGVTPKLPRRRLGKYSALRIIVFSKTIKPEILHSADAVVETGKDAGTAFAQDFAAFGATAIRKELPWLTWLMYEGNKFLVYNYRYEDVVSPNSRSGKGLMIRDDSTSWRVPSQYSGTRHSNWIVKALQDNQATISRAYSNIIKKHMEQ